jgi:GT2 family glycosyltransferase
VILRNLTEPSVVTIIVNFNMCSLVERCVTSLKQPPGGAFRHHVVVWENGSDRSIFGRPLESEWQVDGSSIWYTGGGRNLGYARGVTSAYTKWRQHNGLRPIAVHCANPDTVSEPGGLTDLVKAVLDNGWGAAAPLMTNADGESRPAAYPVLTPTHVVAHFLRLRWFSRFGGRLPLGAPPREVATVDGAYVVFRHEAWEEAGGLDPYFGISSDDHDVCARLRALGWKIAVVPTIRVSHHGAAGRSFRPLLSRLDEIQGSIRYVSKHYPRSLHLVRLGISAFVRLNGGPFAGELSWWARKAPVEIEAATPGIEENFRRCLVRSTNRNSIALASALSAELSSSSSIPRS